MPKQTMVRILRPDFPSQDRNEKHVPTLFDYIEVPRLSTYGTFTVLEMLSMEQMARLYILRNSLGR